VDFVEPDVVGLVPLLPPDVGWVGVVTVIGDVGGGVVGAVESSFARWTINQTRPITPRTATTTPAMMLSLRCRARCADRRML
jgi:hypothetical protein